MVDVPPPAEVRPGEESSESVAPAPTSANLLHAVTADGARLVLRRLGNSAGTPVILIHGLAVNADIWDMPEYVGEGFHYRSLASLLSDAGYDVWLLNLRGHGWGERLSLPAEKQADWCVDHFVIFDLPAAFELVRRVTERRPFVVASSMGSMALAAYSQGAVARLDASGEIDRIDLNPAVAQDRQSGLTGCVFTEMPARLRWPTSLYDAEGRLRWGSLLTEPAKFDEEANYPFEALSRWNWIQSLIADRGEVSLDFLRGDPERRAWWRRLPPAVVGRIERAEQSTMLGLFKFSGVLTGASADRAAVLFNAREQVFSSMKSGVLAQMSKSVRLGSFVSLCGTPDFHYAEHYDQLAMPALVLCGAKDRIANADVTRQCFFEQLPATDKTYRLFADLAHGEMAASPTATEQVYPAILEWLEARRECGGVN